MKDRLLHKTLVERYLNNTATEEELQVFFQLLAENKLDEYLLQAGEHAGGTAVVSVKKPKINIGRYSVAAAALLIIAVSSIVYLANSSGTVQASATSMNSPEAIPGTKKAILRLADGREVFLSGDQSTAFDDGGSNITMQDQKLAYNAKHAIATTAQHMIITPKGGEYQVQLPDGTVVWLNAGTSLKYPTAFTGKERVVELDGEAYFEVAKNPAQPFIVRSAQGNIKVLGTHFNVRAYATESAMKTTLTEGAVLLQQNDAEEKLKPGEMGVMEKNASTIAVTKTNVEQDMAWKNGFFYFDKTPLTEIMTQIGRWYDLDIQFKGEITDKRFVGKISRSANLSEVLNILKLSDISFSMKGRTLIVEE